MIESDAWEESYLLLPRLVTALQHKHVADIACGYYHSAARTAKGALFTWGAGPPPARITTPTLTRPGCQARMAASGTAAWRT